MIPRLLGALSCAFAAAAFVLILVSVWTVDPGLADRLLDSGIVCGGAGITVLILAIFTADVFD